MDRKSEIELANMCLIYDEDRIPENVQSNMTFRRNKNGIEALELNSQGAFWW